MGNVNPAYNNRFRYTFQHNEYGRKIIDESNIEGWDEDDKEYARNKDYDGIFAKFSNNLRFYDAAKDFINDVRRLYGINARIRLIKERKSQEDVWEIAYTGELDLSTWSSKDGAVLVKFNSSNLEKKIRSRRNEKIEIERLTDLSGNTIPPLNLLEMKMDGRRVFLDTKFNIIEANDQANVTVETNAGNTRADTVNIPLNMFSQSHDNAQSTIPQSDGSENTGSTGMMFYAVNDRDRLMQIDLDFDFEVFFQQYENVQWCRYQVCLTTYENGVNYNLKDRKVLLEYRSNGHSATSNLHAQGVSIANLPHDFDGAYPQFYRDCQGSFSGEIELLEGESLALEILLKSDMYVDNNAGVRAYARDIVANLRIQEDSYYQSTKTNGLLAYELFERILRIITSRDDSFKSSYLGRTDIGYDEDGPGALTMNSHGHWIRRFSEGEDLYKKFTTSLKDAYESYRAAFNVGLGIESIGYGEKVLIEDKKYFYNPNVTIRLGSEINGEFVYTQVSEVKRKVYDKGYFSSVEIGSAKGGKYEEVMGLEEVNAKSTFPTVIESITRVYKAIAKYRFDTIGGEIIRRRGIETHPNTDHPFDLDVWMHDVKRSPDGVYELRKWQEVLSSAPLLMFDPDSSYNFLFSPVNMLYNHGWVLNAGLQEYPYENIRYGSSEGKSSVSMQVIGRNLYAENGNIPHQDLQKARFVNEEIEFEYEVDDELIKKIEGFSIILGKKIPNLYGLVEFMNEDKQIERGYLLSLKPNKSGKWKLLKSNR